MPQYVIPLNHYPYATRVIALFLLSASPRQAVSLLSSDIMVFSFLQQFLSMLLHVVIMMYLTFHVIFI